MTTSAGAPRPARRIGRLIANRRLQLTFAKFSVGSVVSTIASQGALTVMLLTGTNATLSSLVAFVAGAIPNFLINRHWTWGRHGGLNVRTEVLPYLAVIIATGLAATAITTVADWIIRPMVHDMGMRTLLLNLAYLGSYGVLFVVKFALLNRVFGRRPEQNGTDGEGRTPEATSPSSPVRS